MIHGYHPRMADTTQKSRTRSPDDDRDATSATSAKVDTDPAPRGQVQTADDVEPATSYAGNGPESVKLNPETHGAHQRLIKTDI